MFGDSVQPANFLLPRRFPSSGKVNRDNDSYIDNDSASQIMYNVTQLRRY